MTELMKSLRVGVCVYCKKVITEADSWSHPGELRGYPNNVVGAFHMDCKLQQPLPEAP